MTNHVHRIMLIVPAAKVNAVSTWMRANVDETFPVDVGPALNASGLPADPVTHNWCSAAWTDAQCKAMLVKFTQLANVTPPTNAQWNAWTRPEKIAWLHSVQAGMKSGYGIWVALSPNDETWDDPQDALAGMGLKVISTPV